MCFDHCKGHDEDAGQVERAARAMVDNEARLFGVADWERSPEWRRDEFRRLAAAALSSLAGKEQRHG